MLPSLAIEPLMFTDKPLTVIEPDALFVIELEPVKLACTKPNSTLPSNISLREEPSAVPRASFKAVPTTPGNFEPPLIVKSPLLFTEASPRAVPVTIKESNSAVAPSLLVNEPPIIVPTPTSILFWFSTDGKEPVIPAVMSRESAFNVPVLTTLPPVTPLPTTREPVSNKPLLDKEPPLISVFPST